MQVELGGIHKVVTKTLRIMKVITPQLKTGQNAEIQEPTTKCTGK